MSLFALVLNGAIVQIDAVAFQIAPPLAWTSDISTVSPAPQIGWGATETNGAWAFTAPAAPSGLTLAQQALAALNMMDAPGGQAIRCFKANVAFPPEWQNYCTELRAIVNGTSTAAMLPTQPAWVTGT